MEKLFRFWQDEREHISPATLALSVMTAFLILVISFGVMNGQGDKPVTKEMTLENLQDKWTK